VTDIVLKANRKTPGVTTIGNDLESHTRALQAISESLAIHERRTKNLLSSFVRVEELIDLGLLDYAGNTLSLSADISGDTGGGGIVEAVVAGNFIDVDATDPANPIVSLADAVRDATFLTNIDESATFPNSLPVVAGENVTIQENAYGELEISASLTGTNDVSKVQVSDLSITSNNVLQDTDLIIPLTAGTWLITFDVMQTQNSTPQMETQLQYTGTVTSVAGIVTRMRATTAFSVATVTALPYSQTETTSDTVARRGSFRLTVSDSGNVKFQARQVNSGATAVQFRGGSSMRAIKIS
jgi:hypothetical protein